MAGADVCQATPPQKADTYPPTNPLSDPTQKADPKLIVPQRVIRGWLASVKPQSVANITFFGDDFDAIIFGNNDGVELVATRDPALVTRFVFALKHATQHVRDNGNTGEEMQIRFKRDAYGKTPEMMVITLTPGDPYQLGSEFQSALDALSAEKARDVKHLINTLPSPVEAVDTQVIGHEPRHFQDAKSVAVVVSELKTIDARAFAWRRQTWPVYITLYLKDGSKRRLRLRPFVDYPPHPRPEDLPLPITLWRTIYE